MNVERQERVRKSAVKGLAMESMEALVQVRENFDENPEAMGYFYDLYHRTYCLGDWGDGTKPGVGTLCLQVPEELILAAGAFPRRLCSGSHAFDQVGSEFMPAKGCPVVKATVGLLQSRALPPLEDMRLVVNPTSCDQKKKAGEMISEMGYPVYSLEIPPSRDTEEARAYWHRSVKRFSIALEKATGQRITRKRLREAIRTTNAARHEYRRLSKLRRAQPPPLLGKDALLVTNAYFFDDIESWTEALARLNVELERRVETGLTPAQKRAPRFLFTGTPPVFPNLKVPLLIEQLGGVIVADEVCSSNRLLYDAVTTDTPFLYDMIPAVADRYLKPCTCPIFDRNEDRKRKLLDMASDYQVDGVIYQAYSGCHLYEMEQQSMGKALAEGGVPMLYLETDYSPDDAGQLSTRVEAFVESIRNRQRKAGGGRA